MDKMVYGSPWFEGSTISIEKLDDRLLISIGDTVLFLSKRDIEEMLAYINTFLRGENDNISG